MRVSDVPMSLGAPATPPDSIKPELFAGKHEAQLGKAVGVRQFGVNQVTLEPGSISSLRLWHEGEDEFVYVLWGSLVLIDENGEHAMGEGSIAGFPAGEANAHHLANRSGAPAVYIVVGTRKVGAETVHYPDDALGEATVVRDATGARIA
jgi:uncharacterized cupin superfamily protein